MAYWFFEFLDRNSINTEQDLKRVLTPAFIRYDFRFEAKSKASVAAPPANGGFEILAGREDWTYRYRLCVCLLFVRRAKDCNYFSMCGTTSIRS
jgi:hypothetical protein